MPYITFIYFYNLFLIIKIMHAYCQNMIPENT